MRIINSDSLRVTAHLHAHKPNTNAVPVRQLLQQPCVTRNLNDET
jgi:hypothetical protein